MNSLGSLHTYEELSQLQNLNCDPNRPTTAGDYEVPIITTYNPIPDYCETDQHCKNSLPTLETELKLSS